MERRRVEAMVAYLRKHAEEIEAMPAGKIQFDFGQDVSGQITRLDRVLRPDTTVDRLSA